MRDIYCTLVGIVGTRDEDTGLQSSIFLHSSLLMIKNSHSIYNSRHKNK